MKIRQLFLQYKTPILYSGGSIAKAFATMIVGFVIAKFISPNDLGLWTTINLAITYSFFLQAGIISGLNLELPFAYGKGEDKEARIMAGTAQTFSIFSSIAILLIGLAYLLFSPEQDAKIKFGVLAVTLFIMLSYYQNYLMSTFRSKNSFLKLATIQLVDAFVNLSTVILVVYFSYYGMIIKAVLVISIYVFLLHITRPIRVGLIWNNAALVKLLKVGLPIFGLVYLDSLSSTVDKLWLLKYTTLTDVGLYSFGFNALSTFTLLSLSVASYIYPRMTYNYGKNNDKRILWQYAKKITIILFFAQIPLVILGYFLIPILITDYFPNYILSISAMQILLFAGFFKGSVVGANALWSIKKWKYMISYQVIYSFLLFSLTFAGIQFFPNKIEGVAYGVLLANILNFISGLSLTYFATRTQ
jgi:O-antigen/teichoic acid export membrane protein